MRKSHNEEELRYESVALTSDLRVDLQKQL